MIKQHLTLLVMSLGLTLIALTYGEKKVEKTMTKSNIVKTDSGLQYEDLVAGTGDAPTRGQTVVVHYTGTFANGQKFDSSEDRGQPFEFCIGTGHVIQGWDEGVMSMRVGGERKLTIPPKLGYGEHGIPGAIPGNSTLIFNVKLLAVK